MARKRSIDGLSIQAIDPSIRACGWASYYENTIKAGTLFSYKRKIEDAIEEIHVNLAYEFMCQAGIFIIEKPTRKEGWSDNKRDSIDKLFIAYGSYLTHGYNDAFLEIKRWTPTAPEWKGQQPKNVTHKRAYKTLKSAGIEIVSENLDHNAKDAIALIATYLQKEGYLD